jgi:dipeptidyl aminopeptidase/acylaminoacyl peptidase
VLVSDNDKNVEDWSWAGKYLVYNQGQSSDPKDIYLLPVNGERRPIPFATGPYSEDNGAISPNGRWLAYRSGESGPMQIYVQPVPGAGMPAGKWQVSTAGGSQPQWRRDGKELYFVSRDKVWAVRVKTEGPSFEAGTPVALFSFRAGPSLRNHFTVTADGQRFLVDTPAEVGDTEQFNVLLNWPATFKR